MSEDINKQCITKTKGQQIESWIEKSVGRAFQSLIITRRTARAVIGSVPPSCMLMCVGVLGTLIVRLALFDVM